LQGIRFISATSSEGVFPVDRHQDGAQVVPAALIETAKLTGYLSASGSISGTIPPLRR